MPQEILDEQMKVIKGRRRTYVLLRCPVCNEEFWRDRSEYRRNERKGRVNLCSRSCQATHMDLSEKKQQITKEILAERNANQWREANPNWKGGKSNKLKPLPGEEKEYFDD